MDRSHWLSLIHEAAPFEFPRLTCLLLFEILCALDALNKDVR